MYFHFIVKIRMENIFFCYQNLFLSKKIYNKKDNKVLYYPFYPIFVKVYFV